MFQQWGDSETRQCKHDYEKHLEILERNKLELEKEREEDERLKERLAEADKERHAREQRILELEAELDELDDSEIDKQLSLSEELDKIRWPSNPRPVLRCGFEATNGVAGNPARENQSGSDIWPGEDEEQDLDWDDSDDPLI